MSEAKLLDEVACQVLTAELGRGNDPWQPLLDGGWIGVGVDESRGGGGGGLAEAAALAEASGKVGSPSPVTEAILAGMLLGASEIAPHELPGAMTGERRATIMAGLPIEPVSIERQSAQISLTGQLIPYWTAANPVILPVALPGGAAAIAMVAIDAPSVSQIANVANEPRAQVSREWVPVVELVRLDLSRDEVEDLVGTLCAARLLGAMRSATELAVQYASERKQFGKSIGQFQAISHALVQATGSVEQTAAALDLAVHAGLGSGAGVTARVIAGRGAGPVASITHQVHAAIGTTREHDLHRFTLRLSAWTNELGRTRAWARRLTERLLEERSWAPLDPTLAHRYTLTAD